MQDNKNTILIEALAQLPEEDQDVIVAMILAKGNRSKAAELYKTNRNKFAGILDYVCDKVIRYIKNAREKGNS